MTNVREEIDRLDTYILTVNGLAETANDHCERLCQMSAKNEQEIARLKIAVKVIVASAVFLGATSLICKLSKQ